MSTARQQAWVELGLWVSRALPRNGFGRRPDAAALKAAAKAVGMTYGDAKRAHSAYVFETKIDMAPPRPAVSKNKMAVARRR